MNAVGDTTGNRNEGNKVEKEHAGPLPLDRRKFFKLFGGGLAVAFVMQDMISLAGDTLPPGSEPVPTSQVGAWIHIAGNGKVSVYTGKVEVGQNIRTSLSQIIAEELHVPLSSINMVMADTDLVPYDAGTFGSRTTPQMGMQLRKAAATARQALLEMAAKKWKSDVKKLRAEAGVIINSDNQNTVGYGELTAGRQLLLPIADNVVITGPTDWKVAGRTVNKINGRAFISGRHQYVSDMKLPGMLYGKVLRAPSYGAKLVSADCTRAKAIPGVVVVEDGSFIGVAAPDVPAATKAMQVIDVKWEELAGQPSSKTIFDYLRKNTSAEAGSRNNGNSKGDIEAGLKTADHVLSTTYHIQYIAHVPLEPRAALAKWENGKLTVWTGTQRPFGVQEDLAETFKITKDKVRVITPDTGSGYGGKHSGEAATEAARLAQKAGRPVKIVWTRQEEFTWAYFRPGGVIEVDGGVKNDGTITAWKFININSGPSAIGTQYNIENQQIAHQPAETPLAQGSYRGLASTANVFARESHIADLARLAGIEQLQFRLKNANDARLTGVLEAAAKAFGWGGSRQSGHGYGIACGFEKGGYVATCAEIAVIDRRVKVVRVTQAFECGAVVNPLHLENQVMGSIVQGLGGALFEAINFAEGKILNASLSTYRVPRFSDIPPIEIVLLDRKDLPSAGAGEAAIIGIAPAIRNAILDATGKALTTLPLLPGGILT